MANLDASSWASRCNDEDRARKRRAFDLAGGLHAHRPRATAQLVATERRSDGMVQDQTRSVEWVSSNPSVAVVTSNGRVIPKANGTATIVARRAGLEAGTTVKVEAMDEPLGLASAAT